MALYLLTLDPNSGTAFDKKTLVIEADDLATARTMAKASYAGPWEAATATTIATAADDLEGWVHRVQVSDGTSATPLIDVSITSIAADSIADVGPDLVEALKGSAVEAAIAEDAGVFVDETTPANEGTADDVTLFPAVPAAGVDRYNIGMTEQFSRVLFDITTVGTGTYTVTYEYSLGGDTWSALTVTDDTTDFKTTGLNDVTFTPPADWAVDTINSQGPFYFIRAETQTGTTTQVPIAGQLYAGAGLRASFSTPTVTVAAIADGIGDESLKITATPPSGILPVAEMITTIVDQGIAGAVLEFDLDAQTAVPNVLAAVDKL